jgi:DNA polymerase-3 subunit gamma/tau
MLSGSLPQLPPDDLWDLVGQGHITTTLKMKLKIKRIAQAYLFSGTRGTGKTTCARIWPRG